LTWVCYPPYKSPKKTKPRSPDVAVIAGRAAYDKLINDHLDNNTFQCLYIATYINKMVDRLSQQQLGFVFSFAAKLMSEC